jgi:lysophospholipase L1-like esterase
MIKFDTPLLEKGETLLCFGDSITASQTGYVKCLQERLADQDITVINAGRGGDKTPWALTRLQSDVIDRKPDAVSIFLGANDAAVGRAQWADEPTVTPEAYRCNIVWMIHLCRIAGIKKFSVTPPLYRFEGETWAEHGDIMVPYRMAARDAADQAKVRLVPADIAFAEEWARNPGHTGLLLTTDGTHLTEKGNQIVADTMLKTWGLNN